MVDKSFTPWGVVDQIKGSIPSEVSWAVGQVTGTVTQVAGVVGKQLGGLSQAVGAEDLLKDTVWWVMPMKDFVIHALKIAFFLDPQQRATRGEFMIGALSSMIVMSIVTALLPIILWGWWLFLSSILMMVPVFNLWIKRFHDMNKPAWWAIMLIIPFFGWIMPALFQWVNENNPYWPDPILKAPSDNQGYIIIILSLFIVSSLLISILSFIGVRVSSAPSVDSTTDSSSIGTQTNSLKKL